MGDMDDYIFDDDGNPVLQCPNFPKDESIFDNEEDCKDIFHIKGDGFDVCLSLAKGLISWTNVNPSGKKKKSKVKDENRNTVMLCDVFGAKLKRKKKQGGSEEDTGLCLGFTLHICDLYGPNTLTERVVVFEHPSEAMCTRYVRKIHEYLATMKGRPKSIKLFLQTQAGLKNGSSVLKNTILPLFQSADVHVDWEEVQHNEYIKQEMVHLNLDDYDTVVAMGGDGTVNKVVDGLMSSSQKYRDIEQKPGFTPTKARRPLGIIPIGCTNDICRSIVGVDHAVSAALYIIMGRSTPVDICTTYSDDRFLQWCFNCQYGFGGNVLQFRKRYKALGKRGLEPAFMKALTKAKLRSYQCDVEFIPHDKPIDSIRKTTPCWRGCDVCWEEEIPEGDVVTEDLVQAFDPLAESNNSDTLVNLAEMEDNPWRSKKQNFLNIGLYTLPGRSELAPRGQSMYTHLNDGAIDLVLIKEAPRKEFIRVLKRLTNSKEQFDFPFIEVLRVKEVKFRLRLPTGFNYNDYNFSEIEYEYNRQKQVEANLKATEEDILEINELSDSDSELNGSSASTTFQNGQDSKVQSTDSSPRSNGGKKPRPFVKSKSVQQFEKKKLERRNTDTNIKVYDDISDDDSDDDDDSDSEGSGEIVTIDKTGVRTVRSASAPAQKLIGPQYRKTWAEEDRAKRRNRAQKKDLKKREKELQKMKSVWNIDYEIQDVDELHVKVHHGLLRVYGLGIAPDTTYNEHSMLCIR